MECDLTRNDGSVNERNYAKEVMGVVLLGTGDMDKARQVRFLLLN
jgi:hypothetical protein